MDDSIQSKGGKARAGKLSAEARTDIARRAADARWGKDSLLPKETHSGALKVIDRQIPCSVLEGGIRVFSTRGINRAMGSKTTGTRKGGQIGEAIGAPQLPAVLMGASVKPFISSELMVRLISPVQYRPKHGGRTAFGYEATLLPMICETILDAQKAGALKTNQKHIADMAELMIRGFARVGVIALVDEATGYQEDRARDELNRILEAYVAKELLPWTRRFPDEYFKQAFKIHGWEYTEGSTKSPRYLGKLINKTIFEPLPPGVLEELRERNPPNEAGYRRHKHHQLLTPDTGLPHLDRQIVAVTTLMRISDDKDAFWLNFNKAFPPKKAPISKTQQLSFEYESREPLEVTG